MMPTTQTTPPSTAQIFLRFLQLGLTAFGGPIAHLAYFREAFVVRQRWLTDAQYSELLAMCQFLPGPTSSQVGFAVGYHAGGWRGALAAWLGFTLPSALLLTLAALGVLAFNGLASGVLQGLLAVTVAVVTQAIWAMAKQHSHSGGKLIIMLLSAATLCLFSSAQATVTVLLCAGLIGAISFRASSSATETAALNAPSFRSGVLLLSLALALLFILPLLSTQSPGWALADSVYRSGALVFGGGHVVLPLLQAELVTPGWLSADAFYTGYGLAQAVPGPLFTVAAYLGASVPALGSPMLGAALLLVVIFLPGLLLVMGLLPFWGYWQGHVRARAAVIGLNAAVVGLLLATLLVSIVPHAWTDWRGVALSLAASAALLWAKWPAWLVVLLSAAAGYALSAAI
ncbi:MAG: chromate efflux transporter [Paraperlucidibaca sp.]